MAKRINRNIEPNQMEKRIYELEQIIAKGGVGGKGVNIRKEIFAINGAELQPASWTSPLIQFKKDGEDTVYHHFYMTPSEGYEHIEILSVKKINNTLDANPTKPYSIKHKWFDSDANNFTDYYEEKPYIVGQGSGPIFLDVASLYSYEEINSVYAPSKQLTALNCIYEDIGYDSVAQKTLDGFAIVTKVSNPNDNLIVAMNQILLPVRALNLPNEILETIFDWGSLNNNIEITFIEY